MPDRIAITAFLLAAFAALATHGCAKSRQDEHARQLAARVRTEFLHAWNNYERYAWGHDALRPLSKTGHDWYGQSLLMTPVDALDTLILMHLDAEAARARSLIVNNLSFDRDIYVKNFEVTIRLLGGLLSSYQLTGDKRLLNLAEDLGNRLLPVFNSPTGLPYVYVNLRTGQTRDAVTNPAETGTLLLEFGILSKLTSRPVFYEKAKRALVETFKRRSRLGLVGEGINVETGGELWYGHADMQTGKRTKTTYGALDAFFPGLLAVSGDLKQARRLQASSFKMWNLYSIEPEILDYKTMHVVARSYHLRPEIVESTYYLYYYTGDPKYRRMGEKMFGDFVKYCRTDSGYVALADVISKQQLDEMESFVLAETFKYFYLLFASPGTLEFDKVIFNTEAHPLKQMW